MDTKKTAYLVVKIICKVCMSLNVALVTHFFNWNLIILNVFKSFFPFHFSVERGFHIFCWQSKSRLENKQQQRNTTSAQSVPLHAFTWSTIPATETKHQHSATRDGRQTCSMFRIEDQGETRKLNIYKERWETEDPKQCWLCIWLFRVTLEGSSS